MMLTYEDCVAFSGNTDYSVATPIACADPAAEAQAGTSPLRSYKANTHEAQARLLALALLADGKMDERELAVLCSDIGLGRLGLSKREFFQVLYDFCADVSRMPAAGGSYNISREGLGILLREVNDPSLRKQTLDLMMGVVHADGKIDHGEAAFLWNVLDAWDPSGKSADQPVVRKARRDAGFTQAAQH